jgi:DNA recombination protein RmuC
MSATFITALSLMALVIGILIAWAATRSVWVGKVERVRRALEEQLQSVLIEKVQFEERATQVPTLVSKLVESERTHGEFVEQVSDLRESLSRSSAELKNLFDSRSQLGRELSAATSTREDLQRELSNALVKIAELTTSLEAERRQFPEKLELLDSAKGILSNEFKTIANEIFDTKTEKFTEHNRTQVDQILQPFKTELKDFRDKAEQMHLSDVQQQATLSAELGQMKELNRQMTEEAHGLATALRGQAKMRGNWGELVLENVLERSGLCRDKDYHREVNFNTDSGRQRPDVVVNLPHGKHIVIDAKVSLNAYARYVNAEFDLERAQALREHVLAVSSRIKELADKNYFELPGLNTPEVVFMFIPIESAFVEALRADESLFQTAIERNVLVATPTTLLTSLNIVRQLWRFEDQNAHSAELAEKAGKIYKKLNTFLHTMQDVGTSLERAKAAYGTACGQLYSGKDNLIKQANDFKRLGVSVQTSLPQQFVEKAELELEYLPEDSGESGSVEDDDN